MKKALSVFLIACLCFSTAACGSATTPAAPAAPDAAAAPAAPAAAPAAQAPTVLEQNEGAATEITVFTWGYPAEKVARESQAQLYMDTHPDVNVVIEVSPDYDRKLAAMLSAGDGPDVFETSDDWFHRWEDELTDLKTYLDRDGMNLDETFLERAMVGFITPEGKVESMPIGVCPFVMAVNLDMFEAAGVTVPEGEWTWEEVLDAALKMTSGEGASKIFGLSDCWMYDQTIPFWFGGDYYNEDKTQVVINSPESTAGFQFWSDLMHVHKVMPTFDEASGVQGLQRFYAGQSAMMPINMWDVLDCVSQIDGAFNWDIVSLPTEASTGLSPVWSIVEGYGIWQGSENQDAAWDYIKWATTDPESLKLSAVAAIPLTPDGVDLVLEQDFGKELDLQKFVDAVPNSLLTLPGGAFGELSDVVGENLNEIKRGGDVKTSLDKVVEDAQPILDRIMG